MATRTPSDVRPRRRTVKRAPTSSASPEYKAISPLRNTKELEAFDTNLRSNRASQAAAMQVISLDEDYKDEPAITQAPANATPIRSANPNLKGQLHSALRSGKKEPGSAQSVRISENAREELEKAMDVDDGPQQEDELESSPMSEPLPRRARIRHSLLPRDENGKLTVRADVMEQRAMVIVTVAQDAIQASLRKELEDVDEEEEIPWTDLEKIWEALDSNQLYIFNFRQSPLFMSTQSVEEEVQLENSQQASLFDAVPSLKQAISLRNLANFLRILLEPDKGVSLLPDEAVMAEAIHPEKLNMLFGHAWNAFLATCIPRMRWASRAAIGLLVDLATQRFMMGYGRWCDLPELDQEAVEELRAIFSDDALRQNAYEISRQWERGDVDETLETLDREWQRAIKIRMEEILTTTPKQLDDVFPFNAFRHELALQISAFIYGLEPLAGLRPEEHTALGQAVRNRGVVEPAIEYTDVFGDYGPAVPLDDDDVVDLLTQAQHVSGRSDQEQVYNPALDQDRASGGRLNGHDDVAVPVLLEPYVDLADDGVVGSIAEDQTQQSLHSEQLNGTLEATQTLGLADLEAFMEGNDEEELLESEEEVEEEETTQSLQNGHVAQAEPNVMETRDNDEQLATTSTNAELGDILDINMLFEETVETMETQESWDIREGKDRPVHPAQIIRGPAQKSARVHQVPLNAPRPDATRMEWEDTQDQTEDVPQGSPSAHVDQPRTLRSGKRFQSAASAIGQHETETEQVTEAQDASAVSSAEARRTRKGKAPMRPRLRSDKGPVWESVESNTKLVSDEEGGTSQNNDSDFEELDQQELADKRRTAPRKVIANAIFGPSRDDIPVVRRSKAVDKRKRSGTAGSTSRSTSASTSPPTPPKKRRVKRGAGFSYMDDYVDDDLFMMDADGEPLFNDDGEPLKEDPTYMEAVPNRKRPAKMPRLEWSEEDKLLLYREIQKCPINAKSSFVSAVLHRYGDPMSKDSSDTLILAQSMQLRDQMKDIVKLRTARDLPVLGNARFYLPSSDPRKADFDTERAGASHKKNDDHKERQKMLAKLRADARKQQAQNAKNSRNESADESTADEDELDAENDEQEAPAARNDEQDELAIENEISEEVQDKGQREEVNGESRSASKEGSTRRLEEVPEADATIAEEKRSQEPTPTAQPTRVLRKRRSAKK